MNFFAPAAAATPTRVDAPSTQHTQLVPESVPIAYGSYQRLKLTQENQTRAREAKDERESRKQFLDTLRASQRARGTMLRDQARLQQRKNSSVQGGLRENNYAQGRNVRGERERARQRVGEAQQAWKDHGRNLVAEVAQFEIRKRAIIEADRRKKEAETISMRNDLKEQKEVVDATNLALKRARVARVRADTADDKIRLAKTSFIDARWDKADRLRQEIGVWKQEKKNAELQYLADAVQTNHDMKQYSDEARRQMLEKREESAAEVRREREVHEEKLKEREECEEERVREAHDAMLGPKVVLTADSPSGGASAIELFGRLFGFRRPERMMSAQPALRGTTPRFHTPENTPVQTPGQTPRSVQGSARGTSARGSARGSPRTPRTAATPATGNVRV